MTPFLTIPFLRLFHTASYDSLINSMPAGGDFCRLLIFFANSLDPVQAQQNVGPDLDTKLFVTLMVFLKEFLKKIDFGKISADD